MITLELTDNDAICILAVMEVHLSELLKSEKTNQYQPMLRAVVQDGCIIGNLREILGLPEYAAEIDKLEAKESKNDSKGMGTTTAETVRQSDDAGCVQGGNHEVVSKDMGIETGRVQDTINTKTS